MNLIPSFLVIFMTIMIMMATCINGQSSSITSNSYLYRLRRRCPTIFPTRTQLTNSNVVVLVGLVEQIKPLDGEVEGGSSNYLANVLVRRVLYGSRSLQKQRIQVTGFNPPQSSSSSSSNSRDLQSSTSNWCYPNTRQDESWIFILQPINFPDYFRLNSSLIKVTLGNLEKFDAIIADKPYGLKPQISDLPCEKKYCENNANCINDPYSPDGARCECLSNCKTSKYEPVCGSDDETYNNECELRMRSCRDGKNIFVKGMNSCYYFRQSGSSPYGSRTETTNLGPSNTYNSYSRSYYTSSNLDKDRMSPSSSSRSSSYSYHQSPSSSSSTSTTIQRPQYPLPDPAMNRWHSSRIHSTSTTLNRNSFAF